MRFIIVLVCFFTTATLNAAAVLHPIQGKVIPFSELQGKWVLINYWASWCQPCLDEIPELNRFYDSNKKDTLALFAVNYDMLSDEMQQQMIQHYHIHYPALKKDPAGPLRLGDIRGVPVTFVFNPQGKLMKTLYGGQTAEHLTDLIKPIK